MITRDADTVVLDIEGTTGSLTHVRDVLFPYARARLGAFFARHGGEPRLAAVVRAVREETGRPALDEAGALAALTAWADADAKVAPLKTVQGWIWAEGYARGELHGHVYPEVPDALRRWREAGVRVLSYSSGSVSAQRNWYRHTAHGDLTPLFHGLFDLETAGPKHSPASYRALRAAVGGTAVPPVFLSDVAAELDAAAAAGWTTVGVRRDADPRGDTVAGHVTVATLDGLRLRPGAGGSAARDDAAGAARDAAGAPAGSAAGDAAGPAGPAPRPDEPRGGGAVSRSPAAALRARSPRSAG